MSGAIVGFLKLVTGKFTRVAVDDQTNPLPVTLAGGNVPVTWTALQTFEKDGIGAVTTPMIKLLNATPATALVPAQYSPALEWVGHFWDGAADQTMTATADLEYQGGKAVIVFGPPGLPNRSIGFSLGDAGGSGQLNFPSVTAGYDANVDIYRGDYGLGAETLNFENFAAGGGYVFASPGPGVALCVTVAGIPYNAYSTSDDVYRLSAPNTVGGLTGGVAEGSRAFVTDAVANTFNTVAVGGGANKVPVFFDGAVWRIG